MGKKPCGKAGLALVMAAVLTLSGFPMVAMADAMDSLEEHTVESTEATIDEAGLEQFEEPDDQAPAEVDTLSEHEQSRDDEAVVTAPEEEQSLPVETDSEA